MNSDKKILIIDDDIDDQEFLRVAIKKAGCKNDILCFSDGIKALAYLTLNNSELFLVLCDINMPLMNGFRFREELCRHTELKDRCTPFLFVSTSNSPDVIKQAFSYNPQGYFIKPNNYAELQEMANSIVSYWKLSSAPDVILN